MKKLLLLIVIVPSIGFAQTRKERKQQERADKITLQHIQKHIEYLASDELEGRRTGSHGETLAMEYIAAQFAKYGLAAKGTNGFVQEFEVNEGKKIDESATHFSVNGKTLNLNSDYFPLPYSANSQLVTTATPGLPERQTPWFYDVKETLYENRDNPHFDINYAIREEAKRASENKATALILYNSGTGVDNIQYNKNDTSSSFSIPVLFVSNNAMKSYFSDPTSSYDIDLKTTLKKADRTGKNVIGMLNFNQPNTVIIGAHYDHLGYGEDHNSLDGQGEIHNGADDNASGTAALIELARILKQQKNPKNNYLFIAFSGEELGLLGSKYWLENPTVHVVPNYMINMDMIGRYDTANKLTIGGYGTSPSWGKLFDEIGHDHLVIKFDSSGSGPSDHSAFYHKDIPVLFFFTNSHGDYHKATDDWQKINYQGEVSIINYINRIIDASEKYGKLSFSKTRDQEIKQVALPVTLGVMPDYGFTGTGMRIDGTSKGKPAEKAGLKAGDILLQLGEYKFVDVVSYMKALQHFKKGDQAKLTIIRDGKEMDFMIQF